MRFAPVALLALAACGRFGFGDAPDARSDDALGDDALPACPANAIVCDDFESGTIAAWTNTSLSTGSVVQVTTVRARSGVFALDADAAANPLNGFAVLYKSIASQTSGVIAMREWYFAPSTFELFDEVVNFYDATNQYMVFGCDNTGHWVATERNPTTGLTDHYTTIPCVKNVWACVEVVYSLTARHATFYVDGAQLLDLDVDDPAPQFSELQVGATRSDAAGFHVHIDDVVFAPQRIGCQ